MIWANPWAWLGLAALAVPVLVHLLARQASTALPFPTLRFLRATPLVDVRRRKISDVLLLVVRMAIVALAVGALAQPFIAGTTAARVNRLVVIDATPSVALEEARAAAATYAGGASAFGTIERGDLRRATGEAAAWAGAQSGETSIIFVSDFQRGALDAAALQAVPQAVGLEMRRVSQRTIDTLPAGVESMVAADGRTSATWPATRAAADSALAIESAQSTAVTSAIAEAARVTAAAHAGEVRPITFVLSDAPRRAALLAESGAATEPWMFDLMSAIDGARVEAVRARDGRALVFLASSDPAAAADAIRQALPAASAGVPMNEREPQTLDDASLRGLERAPAPAAPSRTPSSWAGRWFWLAALLLLGVEAVIRRSRTGAEIAEVARAA